MGGRLEKQSVDTQSTSGLTAGVQAGVVPPAGYYLHHLCGHIILLQNVQHSPSSSTDHAPNPSPPAISYHIKSLDNHQLTPCSQHTADRQPHYMLEELVPTTLLNITYLNGKGVSVKHASITYGGMWLPLHACCNRKVT